jgi:hypothetical protein
MAEAAQLDTKVAEVTLAAWRAAVRGPSPASPRPVARRATRVIMLCGVGIARSRATAMIDGEIVVPGAYGTAATLNRGRCWHLCDGHDGPALEWVGRRLRAIDVPGVPLALEWEPDEQHSQHRRILERLAAGPVGVSVTSRHYGTTFVRSPRPLRRVDRAGLEHVAIVPPSERPVYPGSVAVLFRQAVIGDEAELRRHVAEAVRASERATEAALAALGS